jgi:hypothetical protein
MDSTQAELEISEIKRIMNDSRRILIDDGLGFIVWGILVFFGLLGSYLSVLRVIDWGISGIGWMVLIGGGWIFTFFQVRRERKNRKAVSFAGKIAGAIWGSAGVTMTIIGFAGSYSGLVKGMGISPLMCCILALAFFVSGVVYSDKMFRYLGIGWWIGAVIMFFWQSPHTLLMFALMILVMQVLPGITLYKKWNKEIKKV